MLNTLLLTVLLWLTPQANADVWPTTKSWGEAEDQAFGKWIEKLPLDLFTRKGSPYQGIYTDCADAAYVLRILFAYENGLPVKFSNFDRKDLSNANKTWDSVPEGQPRLRKFINFVRTHTNTQTIVADTYPLEISRNYIKGGALFLHPEGNKNVPVTYRSGHVYYVTNVFENGMIRLISSTVPEMVRDLQPRVEIVFAPFTKDGGYRAWKRVGSDVRPGESEMQFSLGRWVANGYRNGSLWQRWHDAVRAKLALRRATGAEEFAGALENVKGYIHERTGLVRNSWNIYQRKYRGEGCMSESDYDSYSTPTRDVKIQSELEILRRAAVRHVGEDGVYRLFEQYRFQVTAEHSVDLNQLWQAYETDTVLSISEPEHSPEVRWGITGQDRWPCPHRAKQYVGGENIQN
ncbi:MAG: hypothetical protein AB7K68_09715 [Bacteriovoracia bacterium]